MKSICKLLFRAASVVTLYVRVWIEIEYLGGCSTPIAVTLYVRVWIEID